MRKLLAVGIKFFLRVNTYHNTYTCDLGKFRHNLPKILMIYAQKRMKLKNKPNYPNYMSTIEMLRKFTLNIFNLKKLAVRIKIFLRVNTYHNTYTCYLWKLWTQSTQNLFKRLKLKKSFVGTWDFGISTSRFSSYDFWSLCCLPVFEKEMPFRLYIRSIFSTK